MRRAGRVLQGIGIVVIVAAVLWVLEEANGPGTGPKTFAQRNSYDMVKESVHTTFPIAFAAGLGGLGLVLLGARLVRRARP